MNFDSDTFPKLTAVITTILSLVVLAGWVFSIPLLKSVIPGAIEMKLNTAAGLLLASCALFILSGKPSHPQQRWAQIMALAVVALGLAILSQYLFGWQLGIDELLFRDTGSAQTVYGGRASPFATVAFIFTGVALTALPRRSQQPLVRLSCVLVLGISMISFLGYTWNINELVTNSILTPMAVNTAFAFILLGSGTLYASLSPGQKRVANISAERRILTGFIGTVIVLIVAGGYIRRIIIESEDSIKRANHTQQVRLELNSTYSAIIDTESMQRSYLLTGNQSLKLRYQLFVTALNKDRQSLFLLVADNPEQVKNVAELWRLIDHRLDLLAQHLAIFEQQGDAAVRDAIAVDDGIGTAELIRELIQRMSDMEGDLLTMRETERTHNHQFLLLALTLVLAIVTSILAALFLAIRRERTRRTNTERTLRDAKEQAELANRTKAAFLATMSHEIRTPLTGMLGMLELLSMTTLDDNQLKTLHAAWESGRSLLRIVNDILDWSKIEAGKLELAPQSTSIPQLLQDVVNTYSRVASSKNVRLRLQSDMCLGHAHLVDPLRVSQVLNNFVSNAIKFSEQGGAVELRTRLLEQVDSGERICFSVKDTGVGIPKDVQVHLFERYRQESANTARMYGGTGLGLAICQRLVELMDGHIELESEPGQGATFSFTLILPVSGAPAVALESLHPEVEQRAVEPLFVDSVNAPLVLAVDDHPINRDLLKIQINLLGLRAETAENGRVALAMWRQGNYKLVITDCHMPVMDGYTLTREIRMIEAEEARPHTPIIAWTANAMAEEAQRCHAAGMDDLLVKPSNILQLKNTLAKWLSLAETGDSQPLPAGLNTGPVDHEVLKQSVPDSATQIRVLHDFRTHIQSDYTKLLQMLEKGDLSSVKSCAHRMKGSSQMVGARYIANACAVIEQLAQTGDFAGINAASNILEKAIGQLDSHIMEFGKSST